MVLISPVSLMEHKKRSYAHLRALSAVEAGGEAGSHLSDWCLSHVL